MLTRTKNNFLHLFQGLSSPLNLKLPLSLLLELCSCVQILSVVVLPILLKDNLSTQDDLSNAFNKLISIIKPFHIFDPFTLNHGALIAMLFTAIYLLLLFGAISYTFYRIQITYPITSRFWFKALSLCMLVHSKVLFYPIHCFLVKTMDYDNDLDSSLFKNTAARFIVSLLLLLLNIALTTMKEVFCFQVHQNKDTYGIKDNLYSLNMMIHKGLAIILYYCVQNPTATLAIINILFTAVGLTILHIRLPFYSQTLLKTSIVMSTIATWASIVSIGRIIDNNDKNLLLILLATSGIAVKISLIRLNATFKNIRNLHNLTPYYLTHLPILMKEYEQKMLLLTTQDKTNKQTLYSMGFTSYKDDTPIQNIGEVQQQKAYAIIVREMLEIHHRTRNNNYERELLSLCIAQIYIQIFEDAFKAMLILSKLNPTTMNIVTRISLKALSADLEALNFKHSLGTNQQESGSHLDYFIYKMKTQKLKEYIKVEMEQHHQFWKFLNFPTVEALPVINQGNQISESTNKINQYWKSHFENSELLYVNASIMYGLYLKIIQSLPSGGAALVRRAFTSLNNKQHPFKDVIDIVLGNRAVVIASIEPDKIGKIVDTSSSVARIFKMNKKGLIGTNVAMLMPGIIGAHHNDLIKKYHKHSKQSLNKVIKTYAKTYSGEYFAVEITLRLSQFTQNGLNVVASIEKTSEYEPMIIIDAEGNVVECSQDLARVLDLSAKRSYLKIETLCKEFKEVNEAFNLLYTPKTSSSSTTLEKEDVGQDELLLENYLQSDHQAVSKKSTHKVDSIASPRSTRGLLLSSMENDAAPISFDRERENKNTFFDSERPLPPLLTPTGKAHPFSPAMMMTRDEAEKICDSFKYGKEIIYIPPNQKLPAKVKPQEFKFTTEVEPFVFQGKLYKILKLKDSEAVIQRITSLSQTASTRLQKESAIIPKDIVDDEDEFADMFPDEIERHEEGRAKFQKCSIEPSLSLKHPLHMVRIVSSHSTQPVQQRDIREQVPLSETLGSNKTKKKKTYKAQSLVTSQMSQQVTAQQLQSSLKIEKQSPEISFAINMVYLAVIIILGSIFIDLTYTSNSIQYMSDSMDLVGLVNTRLGKALLAWQGILGVYARSMGMRKVDAKFTVHQSNAINSTLDMMKNDLKLLKKVDEFGDDQVTQIFYNKSLYFWEPLTHELFDNRPIDGFTAQNTIAASNLQIARYKGAITDFNGTRRPLYTINNTANDFRLALENTTGRISEFFQKTKDNNLKLLGVIVGLEILFIIIPCALTIYILFATVRLYNKLFHALCKIHNNSLLFRLKQIEGLAALFEESIEDDISYFNEFKLKINIQQPAEATKKPSTYSTKTYQGKTLIVYGVKYILIACLLTVIIIVLITNSLRVSLQSFKELDVINAKILASFTLNSRVKAVIPSFYFSVIFGNDTTMKIRNLDPTSQLLASIDALGDSNQVLLDALSNSNNEIDDPFVDELLRGKVCKYVTSQYYVNCIQNTNGESYGLLGLQPKWHDMTLIFRRWGQVPAAQKTLDYGNGLLTELTAVVNNIYFIIYQLYDLLAAHLTANFVVKAQERIDLAKKIFYINVAMTLLAMLLIRIIVLQKLRSLDLGIRRILRILPYKIIEENKVMSFYLFRTFGKELEVLKRLI